MTVGSAASGAARCGGVAARTPNKAPMEATEELPAVTRPAVMGRYRLGARLGSGGFGTVYAAHDERLDRRVAVKVIPAGAPAPERATREALAAARLDHPGIVAVFDAGEDADARYLVSELVEGRTLDRLAADGDLSDRDVLRVGLALAEALEHAHGRGVIHRDVKPQNVIVPDRPRSARSAAKLTDFGVAHLAGGEPLTRTGDVVGTLAYMAPEQASGHPAGEPADLYSLALVLYEGLAGVNTVRGANAAATARRLGTPIQPLQRKRRDLPDELCAAIDRAVEPRPEDRGTLQELADALADTLPAVSDDGGTILAHPLERAGTATIPPGAARALAALAAAGLAAATATLIPDVSPAAAAAAVGAVVAVLPRVGWLAAAVAAVALLAADRPGTALVIAAAAAIVPLSRGTGRAWSLPAAAPLLGIATLACAYPALAGRARHVLQRAALGAAGLWWILMAEPLLDRRLLFGAEPSSPWHAEPRIAAETVLWPPFESGLVLVALIWALAAAILPWIVRGRHLGPDVVGATPWAAALGSATAAVAQWAGAGDPRGLTGGAVVAGIVALAAPRVLPRDIVDP
jgi:eukaryotic-like serine/threonine-protein kinase